MDYREKEKKAGAVISKFLWQNDVEPTYFFDFAALPQQPNDFDCGLFTMENALRAYDNFDSFLDAI